MAPHRLGPAHVLPDDRGQQVVLQHRQHGTASGADRVRVAAAGRAVGGLEVDRDGLMLDERLHRVGPDGLDGACR